MKLIFLLITFVSSSRWGDFLTTANHHWEQQVAKSSNPEQFIMNAKAWIAQTKEQYDLLKKELNFGDVPSHCQIRRKQAALQCRQEHM
jgi:hypothetical protein